MKTSNTIPKPLIPSNNIVEKVDNTMLPLPMYSYKIIHSLMDQRRYHIMQYSSDKCKHVCLKTKTLDLVGYGITKEEKANMLVEGFNEGKQFMKEIISNTYVNASAPDKQQYNYPQYYIIQPEDNNVHILDAMTE